jgi:hypothetical protein
MLRTGIELLQSTVRVSVHGCCVLFAGLLAEAVFHGFLCVRVQDEHESAAAVAAGEQKQKGDSAADGGHKA